MPSSGTWPIEEEIAEKTGMQVRCGNGHEEGVGHAEVAQKLSPRRTSIMPTIPAMVGEERMRAGEADLLRKWNALARASSASPTSCVR